MPDGNSCARQWLTIECIQNLEAQFQRHTRLIQGEFRADGRLLDGEWSQDVLADETARTCAAREIGLLREEFARNGNLDK